MTAHTHHYVRVHAFVNANFNRLTLTQYLQPINAREIGMKLVKSLPTVGLIPFAAKPLNLGYVREKPCI